MKHCNRHGSVLDLLRIHHCISQEIAAARTTVTGLSFHLRMEIRGEARTNLSQ